MPESLGQCLAALKEHRRRAADGEVVGLGAAGGEEDLRGLGADEGGDLGAAGLDGERDGAVRLVWSDVPTPCAR